MKWFSLYYIAVKFSFVVSVDNSCTQKQTLAFGRKAIFTVSTLLLFIVSPVWLCDTMDCSMPGFLVLHYLLECAQIHVLWVMQSNHLISFAPFSSCPQSFPPSGSFPMTQGLFLLLTSGFRRIGASVLAPVLPMNIQSWFPFRIDWFDLLAVQGTLKSIL